LISGYTGYIDIQARHLFFYFFESRNDPNNDDIILWTNGGPGCSSSLGLFFELGESFKLSHDVGQEADSFKGPCRITDADGPKFHPESWNTNANIFFIDQPVGVGFSYAEFGETVVGVSRKFHVMG
jgi:carboxypeptidase C (cathepsin A)